jgi:hypothetical protein
MNLVFIYRNLHKKCWSVKDWKTKRVIAHMDELHLTQCTFKVSEAGRQRALKEQRKNVHAGVLGYLSETGKSCEIRVTYNPYKMDSFQVCADNSPICKTEHAFFDKAGHVFIAVKL